MPRLPLIERSSVCASSRCWRATVSACSRFCTSVTSWVTEATSITANWACTAGAAAMRASVAIGNSFLIIGMAFPVSVAARARGQHLELRFKTSKIEPADDTLAALLHQKCARARLQLFFDEGQLAARQAEASGIVLGRSLSVRKEDLGWCLLDDGSADGTFEDISGALRGETHDAIELAPGLRPVFGEALKGRIREQPPELVHPADEPAAIEQLAHEMKKVHRDRRTHDVVVEKLGHIEADHRPAGQAPNDRVTRIVEHPRVSALTGVAPAAEPCMKALGIRGVEKLHQTREPPRPRRE